MKVSFIILYDDQSTSIVELIGPLKSVNKDVPEIRFSVHRGEGAVVKGSFCNCCTTSYNVEAIRCNQMQSDGKSFW